MKPPNATTLSSPPRCLIPRTILFVFWFTGRSENRKRRSSPAPYNRPCTKSSIPSSISHASPRRILRETAVPLVIQSPEYYRYYARHACECVLATRVRSHPFKHHEVTHRAQPLLSLYFPILLLLIKQSTSLFRYHYNWKNKFWEFCWYLLSIFD